MSANPRKPMVRREESIQCAWCNTLQSIAETEEIKQNDPIERRCKFCRQFNSREEMLAYKQQLDWSQYRDPDMREQF